MIYVGTNITEAAYKKNEFRVLYDASLPDTDNSLN